MESKNRTMLKDRVEFQKPKEFAVIVYNDDTTTMDFVVELLIYLFNKEKEEATLLMLKIHNEGKCKVGVYTYDIATTKKLQGEQMAAEKGFPLKITIDEVL